MFKNHLLHGLTAGILSGVACLVFMKVYREIAFVDFSLVISIFNIFGACIFGSVLASSGYYAVKKVTPKYGEIVFNLLFTLVSFASIIGPIMFTFPPELDIEGIDEITSYFQPFAMTLHFFPALIWYTVKPLFVK
jgi:hypothetical protein